ncbi:WW domain-containing transcription regulator protein 1 [Polypterus senegalus]|uniref:WW domain-containing transcription regulator protein 1 n=1 Tax=Polypterus senegalus TaxID=55291 RepID=UPI00196448F1|nr:WW domain-containing transcription regulator protein 1 [Polypterus senegalus]
MNTNSVHPLPGQQVILVAQDLNTELEELFNTLVNPKPSSWRKKVLPDSFFKEPDSGSHSRQSSSDSGSHPPQRTPQHFRSYSSPASLQPGAAGSATPGPTQHTHLRHQSFDVADELPLPPGWEMAFTSNGQRYFLNHLEKRTTWEDPRKAVNAVLNQISHNPPANTTTMQQRTMAMSQPNLVMTHHHQQQQQQQHLVGTSGPVSQQNLTSPNTQAGMMTLSSALTAQQQHHQKLRLQRIQIERERIRMRQEELLRQEAALCRQLPIETENLSAVATASNPPQMTQDLRTIPNNGSDPFLNSGPYHSREQSSDSGLGLGCYSIPTTPEDFLNNPEEMDTGENMGQPVMNVNPQSRFPDFLDSLPGTNVDLGTLESEDLIPILNDVESVLNKSEPFLTWL